MGEWSVMAIPMWMSLNLWISIVRRTTIQFDTRSLKKRYARTNVLKNSFFHRIVDSWNTLPFETRSESSMEIFKSKVVNFLMKM